MLIPQKINPCPIIEAIVELRFISDMPSDAIFGVIYNEFKNEYLNVEKLPILQLPDAVRTHDSNFKFQPHYKLLHKNYIFQIGPNVLSVVNVNGYVGWNQFASKIKETIDRINNLSVLKKFIRLGIRYINFFELDVFDNINLKILLSENLFESEQITFRSTIKSDKFFTNLQILNNGNILIKKVPKSGSLIDIDTYIQDEKRINFSNITDLLEEGHIEEKKLFFNLLKDEFIKKYNPEY
jgi:uncharacterized protein (TIGR04255 family)